MEREIKKQRLFEINQLVTQIVGINDKELSDKACKILNRRRDLLFNIHVDNDYHIQIDDIVVNSLKTIINNYMETKEIKIIPPEGYDIDQEHSTFECIKFRPITKKWRDDKLTVIRGYYIDSAANICGHEGANETNNYNIFTTEKQAKSALAMARISQIMANDERFGGIVLDREWNNNTMKYCIARYGNYITVSGFQAAYHFLAFHTSEQRDLFLKENEDLVKDYLMID